MGKVPFKKLRELCQPNKPRSWSEQITRKYSIFITWFVIKLPITANQVTLMSIIFSLMGMSFFIISNSFFIWFLAVFIFFISYSLDCVDGEVARYRGISSLSGLYFDRFSASLNSTFLYFGLMIRGFLLSNNIFFFIFGTLAILSIYLPGLAMGAMYQTAVEAILKTSNVKGTILPTRKSNFITLDQISNKEGFLKQVAWFLLGQGRILALLSCTIFEYIIQTNGYIFLKGELNIEIIDEGFFFMLFLAYYGILWLFAGIVFFIQILTGKQTEGLYSHLISIKKID